LRKPEPNELNCISISCTWDQEATHTKSSWASKGLWLLYQCTEVHLKPKNGDDLKPPQLTPEFHLPSYR
jgi:hypothetical protein